MIANIFLSLLRFTAVQAAKKLHRSRLLIHQMLTAAPYGAVTTLGTAFRQPKQKSDFYSLFDNWILKDKEPSPEQQHYIMAVLIRGGVFGASLKE